MTPEDFENALSGLLDNDLTPEQFDELQKYLQNSQQARAQYLDYVDLHNVLDLELAPKAVTQPGTSKVIPIDRIIRRQNRRSRRIALAAAAAILIIALVTMKLFFIDTTRPPTLAFETSPGTQFTITHDGSEEAPVGQIMEKGSRLQLSQGTVELTFGSGVKSIVMAPADLTLRDDNQLYLSQGTAWFHVPKEAIGFRVKTKDLNIIDLGTEFGVLAKPNDHDEIHVIQGKVKVTANRVRKESAILTANEARRIDPIGRLDSITSRPSTFITSLPKSLPYLHWSFDEFKNNCFPVDGSSAGKQLANATLRGEQDKPQVIQGKFGNAIDIQHYHQELLTAHPGISGDKPRTIACWVKINRKATGPFSRHTIAGWGDRGLTHHSRRWQLAVAGNDSGGSTLFVAGAGVYRGSSVLNDNQWHHVACVWSPASKQREFGKLTAYVDGRLEPLGFNSQNETVQNTQTGHGACPVVIGATMHVSSEFPATFKGSIDELFIIEGALTHKDILHLMETNLME